MKYRLIILLVIIGSLGNNLMAIVWDGTSKTIWTQGQGTKNAPYLIETPAQLAYLSTQVKAGNNYNGVYFLQTNDLDIDSKSWDRIGNSSTTPFGGKYDGGKHQILNIKNSVFGYVQSATISNLTIAGASTYPIIYETSGNTTVVNCNNKSTAEVCYAGLIRKSTKVLHITNCSNYAKITQSEVETKISHHVQNNDSRCAAGIVAVVDSLYATNCYNRGAVSINAKNTPRCSIYAGGIVGYVLQGAIIGKCFNRSSISGSGGYEVSYACAGISCGGRSIIDQCYNTGNMGGTGSGIAFDAAVTNCYSKGTLVSLSFFNSYGITNGSSHNCYFAGNSISKVTGGGGNTYYLETCAASDETVARPKSEGEMKSQSFLDLLNADGEYFCKDYTNSNGGFPVLRWQLGKFYPIRGLCKSEQGTITGAGDYPKGAEIQLTATPKDNFVFAGWSDGITDNPRTIKVEGEATYVAQFERTSYTVYVNQDCSITVE